MVQFYETIKIYLFLQEIQFVEEKELYKTIITKNNKNL